MSRTAAARTATQSAMRLKTRRAGGAHTWMAATSATKRSMSTMAGYSQR